MDGASPAAQPTPRPARGHRRSRQALRRRHRARRRLARRPRRRGPRPPRRERRRQVDAPQDPLRRPAARRSGTHHLRRRPLRRPPTRRGRAPRGIVTIYQELSPHPDAVGGREHLHRPRPAATASASSTGARMRREARGILARVGLAIDPDTPVSALSVAEQQLVEIARALSLDRAPHHHGRADLGPDRVRGARASSAIMDQLRARGRRDHVRHPPPRGSLRRSATA